MADQPAPKFEQKSLEADLARLAEEVRRHKNLPDTVGLNDREILRKVLESISEREPSQPSGLPATQASPTPAGGTTTQSMLPAYAQSAPAETKLEIEYFLDMALTKGVVQAYNEARKSNPFVLDAFHDALAGKLLPELEKRGLIR
ncbi:MAG: hypothetical protein HY978_03465 [Candidatus Liptonbacteria bacterium]|nr:hypothetical protein [Candidatus Liptonbacteria bacterium]